MALHRIGFNAEKAVKTSVFDLGVLQALKDCQNNNRAMVCRWILLLFLAILSRILVFPMLSRLQDTRLSYQWMVQPILDPVVPSKAPEELQKALLIRGDKFLEVPQIVWGLNNQKIAVARAALTARELNRTLVVPSLSASLFYKETDLLEPMAFDRLFSLHRFNKLCDGFVRLGRPEARTEAFVVRKGNGRRWTAEKDMAQLNQCMSPDIDRHSVIRFTGKNPFLWHDHWPVRDYARVFRCLVLVDNLSAEVSTVVSRLRSAGHRLKLRHLAANFSSPEARFVAVHMRIERDWMIHCKKLEERSRLRDGRELRICSGKEEIIARVGRIPGLERPSVVYLAVADVLLEDKQLLDGWSADLVPYEKKTLGVSDVYSEYPYLVQAAIDYEVCLQADVFVGNSFSTFSSLVVLERTVRSGRVGFAEGCGDSDSINSYAYNLEGSMGRPQRWMTDMADLSLRKISYGTSEVSCLQM